MTRWCRSSGQDLFDGPIDIVGDVHGEIEALESLLRTLGYEDGLHPEGRRLVFLGDLTDRGPDSPTVIDFVKTLVDAGNAQCVLGNHDLNILLDHRKHENHWFFGGESSLDGSGEPTPAVLADDTIRQKVLDFFRSLPLVLEREDLRIVHACWDERKSSSFSGEYQSRLAALRFPELVVVFDDGKAESLNAKSLVQA